MDPSQAAQDIFEHFMMRQWFVSAILVAVLVFVIIAFLWVLNRQDKRDKDYLSRSDKRDEEIKTLVHNDHNVMSTNSLVLQALASSDSEQARAIESLTREVIDIKKFIESRT